MRNNTKKDQPRKTSATGRKKGRADAKPSKGSRPPLKPGFFHLPTKSDLDSLRDVARRFKSRSLSPAEAKELAEKSRRRNFSATELILCEDLGFFPRGRMVREFEQACS